MGTQNNIFINAKTGAAGVEFLISQMFRVKIEGVSRPLEQTMFQNDPLGAPGTCKVLLMAVSFASFSFKKIVLNYKITSRLT